MIKRFFKDVSLSKTNHIFHLSSLIFHSEHSQLMQEYGEDAERTHVAHQEVVEAEESAAKSTVVGELIIYHLTRYKPSKKQTSEEAYDGKKQLTRYEVEEIEQRTAKQCETVVATQRQRTEHTYHRRAHNNEQCGIATRQLQLLMTESGTHLYKRHE